MPSKNISKNRSKHGLLEKYVHISTILPVHLSELCMRQSESHRLFHNNPDTHPSSSSSARLMKSAEGRSRKMPESAVSSETPRR